MTITRDDWGIAHVHGRWDADAVFGMIYAQAEDDFPRIETNYLTNLGRLAEADGESAIWKDLRARLFVSDNELKADYRRSPLPMRRLMDAWADGLNYFLATHPQVRPRVLTRFEPWMVMSFTEGSIGGDIERIPIASLREFYSGTPSSASIAVREAQGSNGIAIAPPLTRDGHALLLINPHTSWYFRSELQVSSDEGLNAYGAATWGQFFIYQGFNPHAGWMHTSSGVDNVDEFAERVERRGAGYCYRYGLQCRALGMRPVSIRYRKPDGAFATRNFATYRTHHGPVIRSDNGRWVAFAMMNKPVEALQQSFLRTKAADLPSFLAIADRFKANSSNNTIFADDKGEIAYLHPQFVPRREDRFDYSKPVDGSDPATDWRSMHRLDELPSVLNPRNNWVQNTNTWPYRAAGALSADPSRFPKYMDLFGENYRGVHALQLLTNSSGWTLERLNDAAFDNYQPGFAALLPTLFGAYDALPKADARRASLAAPIAALRAWDFRWSVQSVPQTLAMAWALGLKDALHAPADEPTNRIIARLATDTTADQKLAVLQGAIAKLQQDFGTWQVPWGEINRFQRISAAIDNPRYSDAEPSIPIPFANGYFGSLASVSSKPRPGTRRWYGDYGNSFVAVVEFGKRIRAVAVTAGGESGHPTSPHFNDQAQRYASGNLRQVYFYPDQLKGHTKRVYRPGD